MARFIPIKVEFPDPEDEDGSKPFKEKTIFFSPLKVKYLGEFKEVMTNLQKKSDEDEKKLKDNPEYLPDRFSGLEEVGKLLFKLACIKHKKMTREEFDEDISVSDYREIMNKLAAYELDV